jgi:catalase
MKLLVLTAIAAATSALTLSAMAQSSAGGAAPVDPNTFLNQFESTFGKFEGYRRSGAKGICATGEFVGSADARALSTFAAFSGQPVPVVVRFSVGGANPKAPDNTKGQRNMALQFNLPGGETWQMGNISAPVFGASTPSSFWAG